MYVLCLINNSFLVVKTFKGLPCISSGLHCLSTDLILLTHRELPPHCKLVPTGLNWGLNHAPFFASPSSFQATSLFHSGPHLHQKEVLIVVKPWWEGVEVACIPLGCGPAQRSAFQIVLGIFTKIFWGSASCHPTLPFSLIPTPTPADEACFFPFSYTLSNLVRDQEVLHWHLCDEFLVIIQIWEDSS